MPGSKTNAMNPSQVLAAVRAIPPSKDFVWDGASEDDRPATSEELQAGIAANRKRGRPAGSATKEQVAIRFDHDVLTAFRTASPGWQTRMNDALRDWLKMHFADKSHILVGSHFLALHTAPIYSYFG